MKRVAFPCLMVVLSVSTASAVRGESVEWLRQLGTSGHDVSNEVSADGLGNVYISGYTDGSLGGPNAGSSDAFVSKYDAAGTFQWTRQLGTGSNDQSNGVSADGLGNVYISGFTRSSLGGPNAGLNDAFVSKYDAAGTLQWTQQLGTSGFDESKGVSADALGSVYISGFTGGSLDGPNAGSNDAFVSKYDATGTLLWSRQLGTSGFDESSGVSADGLDSVYISGTTRGSLSGPNAGSNDAFVAKYDAAGILLWSRQLGTSADDEGYGVSADGLGNVYISGTTRGSLGGPNAGSSDAFVAKYDAAGTLLWSRQLGTSSLDQSYGVSADASGHAYLSGYTVGDLGGPNSGIQDAYVAKYDATGTLLWSSQVGTSMGDYGFGVSADGLGSVYFSGQTTGSLGGPNVGGFNDAFVAKIADVPEPTSILLFALAIVPICLARKRFRSSPHLLAAALLLPIEFAPHSAHAITIDTVPIGNPGNPADTRYIDGDHPNGVGAVGYPFRMGTTEITNAQYVDFLNAVAKSDAYGLFTTSMSIQPQGGILRSGASGNWTYRVKDPALNGQNETYTYDNKPVVYVSSGDAMRFANWLHNHQPNGDEDASTTEDGAYFLNGATSNTALANVTRKAGARWWLPNEAEWYKAAYHKNDGVTGNYWDYPTGTNDVPNNNSPSSDTGNSANHWYTTGDTRYPLTNAGAYTLSRSPYGTFDQGGNVWDWNETLFDGVVLGHGMRGGSWQSNCCGGSSFHLGASFWFYRSPTSEGNNTGFRVATIPDLPGDFNRDGTVDTADYVVWRKTGINGPTGYNTWRTNFGEPGGSASGASANATVPEPTTLVLLMFAAAGWCLRRGRAAWKVPRTRQRVRYFNNPPVFEFAYLGMTRILVTWPSGVFPNLYVACLRFPDRFP